MDVMVSVVPTLFLHISECEPMCIQGSVYVWKVFRSQACSTCAIHIHILPLGVCSCSQVVTTRINNYESSWSRTIISVFVSLLRTTCIRPRLINEQGLGSRLYIYAMSVMRRSEGGGVGIIGQ